MSRKMDYAKRTHAFSISALRLRPYLMQKCLSADRGAKLTSKYGTLPPSDVRSDYAFMLQSSRLVLGQMGCFYKRHLWTEFCSYLVGYFLWTHDRIWRIFNRNRRWLKRGRQKWQECFGGPTWKASPVPQTLLTSGVTLKIEKSNETLNIINFVIRHAGWKVLSFQFG